MSREEPDAIVVARPQWLRSSLPKKLEEGGITSSPHFMMYSAVTSFLQGAGDRFHS